MKLVIKIGGSLAIGRNGPKHEYFSKILPALKQIDEENKLSVGIGGGMLVRKYGEALSDFGLEDEEKEECFIQLIKANVKFLSYLLDKRPLFSLEGYQGEEVVVGGIKPGRSTDANSALVAKKLDADLFVILTDVDGIYNKDPKEYQAAEKIDTIGFEELEVSKEKTEPLQYGVVDPKALEIIRNYEIETRVINGTDPENILKSVEGKEIGTHITHK